MKLSFPPSHELYAWADATREERAAAKQRVPARDEVDEEGDEVLQDAVLQDAVACHVPSCDAVFASEQTCALHYETVHRHACGECGVALPTAHLLELHVEETHDEFFALLRRKRAAFRCLLPDCSARFASPALRWVHCRAVHEFPASFRVVGLELGDDQEDVAMEDAA